MAERRMFASKIIESDAFLDLSPQAQMLYVHLCMEADDDGFLNNARSIKRATGCTDKELNELFQKRFLLDLGDGVTVIKHWKINNYIQKDRYKPTAYQEKYELLEVKPNGAYTEKNKACIQQECERVYSLDTQEGANPVYSLDTQVSIGKVSIGKDIYTEPSAPPTSEKHKYGEYKHVLLTDQEYNNLKTEYGIEETKEAIKKMDEYIEMKGTKYKSHYLAMKKWAFDAIKKDNKKMSFDEALKNA